jgi:proteic killer suppression protein
VIRTFGHTEAEKVFRREFSRKFHRIAKVAKRKLDQLHAAASLSDLRAVPGNHLEALGGDRLGQHNIRVNDRWRICFAWRESDAFDVEIADYH